MAVVVVLVLTPYWWTKTKKWRHLGGPNLNSFVRWPTSVTAHTPSHGTTTPTHGTATPTHGTNTPTHGTTARALTRRKWNATAEVKINGRDIQFKMAESMGDDLGDDIFEEDDKEGLIRYYFFRGFEYEEIRLFLLKNPNIEISLSTLKRRIKRYGRRWRYSSNRLSTANHLVGRILDSYANPRLRLGFE